MVRIDEIDELKPQLRHRRRLLEQRKKEILKTTKDRSPQTLGYLLKTVGPPPVPKCAALGFYEYPFLVQVSSVGMFCAFIGVLFPYWAWTWNDNSREYAVFGLWYYCPDEQKHCTSIHDNLIQGRDVPVFFVMVQWTYLIGVAMSLIVLAILMHNYNGDKIKMSPTVYTSAESVSAIGALQKFVSLYTFVTYFDHMTFIHDSSAEIDFHGAFYCGVISFCCDVIIAVVLFLDEDVGPLPVTNNILLSAAKEFEHDKLKMYKQGADTYLYNPITSEMEYHLVQPTDIPELVEEHLHLH